MVGVHRLSSLDKWVVWMLRFPSLWNFNTITIYRNHWQNFNRATFEPHRATTSLAECLCFILFCLVLVCFCIFFFLIANYRVHGSRMQYDCGWPAGLTKFGMKKNTEQLQSSRKTENMVAHPRSISPRPQAHGSLREDTFNPFYLSNICTCTLFLC